MQDRGLTPKQAVEFLRGLGCLRVTIDSLAVARVRGGGPEFEYDGRYIVYPKRCLIEWARLRRRVGLSSTSSPGLSAPDGFFEPAFDHGDLIDYRDPDPYFDEITAALDEQQMAFDYHHELRTAIRGEKCPFCAEI